VTSAIAAIAYLLFLTLGTYAVPEWRLSVGATAVPYAVALAAALAALGLVESAARRRRLLNAVRALAKWTALYVCATLISLVGCVAVDAELTVKAVLMAGFPLLAAVAHPSAVRCRRCILLLGVSSLAVLIYGVYGYITGAIGDPEQHRFGYLGVTYLASTRNGDSLYFQTLLWIALAAAVLYPSRRWLRFLLFVAALGAALGVILTQSRGAWIAVAVTGLVLQLRFRRFRLRVWNIVVSTVCLCIAVVYAAFFSPEETMLLLNRRVATMATTTADYGNSNGTRLVIARGAFDIIAEHPIFGVGYANMRYFLPARVGLSINHAENTYLQVLAEQGSLGLGSFLGLLVWVIRGLLRLVSREERRFAWAAVALLALVVDFAVFAMFNNVLDNMWFWSIMALAAIYVCAPRGRTAGARQLPLRVVVSRCAEPREPGCTTIPVTGKGPSVIWTE
jgi:O-antigen ligase